jgi:hypothetical protein
VEGIVTDRKMKRLSEELRSRAIDLDDMAHGEEISPEWLAGQLRRIADELEGEK